MESSDDLEHEVAVVAAFLADVTGFSDDESGSDHRGASSSSYNDPSGRQDPATSALAHVPSSSSVPAGNSTATPAAPSSTTGHSHSAASDADTKRKAEEKRAARNAKAGKRRDAYRARLKAEWENLRLQEGELTERLEELRSSRSEKEGDNALARSAWRALAMRQSESRRLAEEQQRRLQTAVASRAQLLRDVESLLRKRLREVEARSDGERAPESNEKRRRPDIVSDNALFEAYLEELDPIYAQTDEAFRTCDATPTSGAFLTCKPPTKRDGDTEYLENLGVQLVPFDLQRTSSATWELTRQPYRQVDRQLYEKVPDPENTYAIRFRIPYTMQTGGVVTVLAHFVARRYVEPERTVVVWRELWEGEGALEGLHSDETGWSVVQPAEKAPKTVGLEQLDVEGPMTLIRNCVRLVPMHFSDRSLDAEAARMDADQFTEVLVTSGREDNLQVEQMMERLQLGDAIAVCGGDAKG